MSILHTHLLMKAKIGTKNWQCTAMLKMQTMCLEKCVSFMNCLNMTELVKFSKPW